MAVDVERLIGTAVDSFLHGEDGGGKGNSSRRHETKGRLGATAGLAVGVGLGLAARAAFRRLRDIDLEQAAGSLEERLKR
jgi:hypothetical protein